MTRSPVRRRRQGLTLLALPVAIAGPLTLALLNKRPMIEPALLILLLAFACAQVCRRVASLVVLLQTRRTAGAASSIVDEATLVARLARLCSEDRSQARLARLVDHLGHEAGLPDTMTLRFATASSLHGLGRLLSPQTTDRAAEAQLAARLLADGGPLFSCASDMARFHRERWDGRDSVQGLAGEAIPLSARLLSVALALDLALPDCLPPDAGCVMQAISTALGPVSAEAGHALDPTLTALLIERSETLVRTVQPDVRIHSVAAGAAPHAPAPVQARRPCLSPA